MHKNIYWKYSFVTRFVLLFSIAVGFLFWVGSCGDRNQEVTKASRTFRLWHTEVDLNAAQVVKDLGKAFEESHPGVVVEIQAIKWDDLNQKLQAAILTGDVPDLTHLEPFMTASLVKKNLLLPLDDLFEFIGKDDIYPAVRDLQLFDGHRYGLAYAVGTTFFAVRRDLMEQTGLDSPKTWDEYLNLVSHMQRDDDGNGVPEVYGVVLPGTPFFIDQFVAELVASNGGRLYDAQGRPTFTEKPIIETLSFLKKLSEYAPPEWTNISYLEQFQWFTAGRVASVPVFYARAIKNIENDSPNGLGTPDRFTFIPQPHGPSGTTGYTTMDCENWAILRSAKHPDLAMEFLKMFYAPEHYGKFCRSVPIHLTPVRMSIANSAEYLEAPLVSRWITWQKQTDQMLASNRALPILMTHIEDRNIPYLMELGGAQIITSMVTEVCVAGKDPYEAASRAQNKVLDMIQRMKEQ